MTSESNGTLRGIEGLTERERHRLLASARRRAVLTVLAGTDGEIDLDELAPAVAAREEEAGDGPADVRVTLHHVHLPMLADAGVLDYDHESCRVDADGGLQVPLVG